MTQSANRGKRGRPVTQAWVLEQRYLRKHPDLRARASGEKKLKGRDRNYFEGSDGAGVGVYLRVRLLMDEVGLGRDELIDRIGLSGDFLSKADGRCDEEQQTSLLELARERADSEGRNLNLDERYFSDLFVSVEHLRRFLTSENAKPSDLADFPADLEGLPAGLEIVRDEGRERLLHEMHSFLTVENANIFILRGNPGDGKTMLFSEFVYTYALLTDYRVLYINCTTTPDNPQVVGRIYDFVCRNARDRSMHESNPSMRDMVVFIMQELERHPHLIVFDDFDSATSQYRATYHAVRDDSLFDLIRHATQGRRRSKIFIGANCNVDDFDKMDEFAEVPKVYRANVPDVEPACWIRLLDEYTGENKDEICRSFLKVIELLDGQPTTGLVMSGAASLLIARPDSDVGIVARHVRGRDLRALIETLLSELPETFRWALRLVALSEDGLRRKTMARCLDALVNPAPEDIESEIRTFTRQLCPLVRLVARKDLQVEGLSSDDTQVELPDDTFDVHADVRQIILLHWEQGGELADKRRAHREIACIALGEAIRHQLESRQERLQSLGKFRRDFQAFIHLLASVDPSAFPLIENLRPIKDKDIEEYEILRERVLEREAKDNEVILFAWNLWIKEIEARGDFTLSRHFGADAVKLEMLLRLFHLGFSYPSPASPLSGEYRQLPALKLATQSEGTNRNIPSYQADYFSRVAIASLRTHNFSMCASAIDIGRRIANAANDENAKTRFALTLIDMLVRQGRLTDAEWASERECKRFEKERLPSFARRVRQDRSSNTRRRDLLFMIKTYKALLGRSAEILYLQGRFFAASIKFYESLDGPEEYLDLIERGMRNIHVKGTAARSFLRFAIRAQRYNDCGQFNDTTNILAGRPIDEFPERANTIFSINYERFERESSFENERAALELDRCVWERSQLRSSELKWRKIIGQAPNAVQVDKVWRHLVAARERMWSGFVSPLLRMELLKEEAVCYWLRSSTNERTDFVERALSELDRLLRLSERRGYPLLECDALLLRAEILAEQDDRRTDRERDLERAYAIILERNYGLRLADWQLIQKGTARPSQVLIC